MTDPQPFYVADLFCGAGGSSSGAMLALKERGLALELVAVNHWGVAIATHQKNHPHAVHYVEDVTQARPSQVVPGGYLDLLMASPECIFHSRARGGKPVSDQGRMAAWAVQRWLTDLDVTALLVENVPEFVDWGPLDAAGHPIPSKKGLYFQTWQNAIRELGYAFEWEYLNAADYGEATTRTRFFGMGRKDGRRVMFPVPSHKRPDKRARPTLFDDGRLPWRPAREVLDLDHKGRSLLTDPKYKKQPLADKTRARIARGLLKFNGPVLGQLLADLLDVPAALKDEAVGQGPAPFVVVGRENNVPRGVDEPLQTVTCNPAMQLVTPEVDKLETFVLPQRATNAPRSTDQPLPTITTVARQGLVEGAVKAFVLGQQSGSAARAVSQPLPTIATDGAIAVVVPVLSSYNAKTAPHSLEEPVPTITAKDRFALVTPRAVVVGRHSSGTTRSLDDPLPTATTFGIGGMATPEAAPFLLSKHADFNGAGGVPARSVDAPTYTATTAGAGAIVQPEVEPFLVPKLGERDGQAPRVHAVSDPLPTVTCVGAGRLVHPDLVPYTEEHAPVAGVVDAAIPTLGPALDPVPPTLVQLAHTADTSGRVAATDAPLTTLTTRNNTGLVQPALDPTLGPALHDGSVLTVPTGFDPRRLVVIDGALFVLDIFFRMLKNAELAAAMGFTAEDLAYEFSGTQTDVTKQIGNAVSVRTARALVGAVLDSPAVEQSGVADAAG